MDMGDVRVMERPDEEEHFADTEGLEALFRRFYPDNPPGIGVVVPLSAPSGDRWWITLDVTEADPNEWTIHKEHGLPLPAVYHAHQLLDADAAVYATYELALFSGSTRQCYAVTVWTAIESTHDLQQKHLRNPSIAAALEITVPELITYARWEVGRKTARKYAQRLATNPSRPESRGGDDLHLVAEVYEQAGENPREAVENAFGLSPSQARRRIAAAREKELIRRPAPRGGRPRKVRA